MDHISETRPTKKARLMALPDGFQTATTPTLKKLRAPKFTSAFEPSSSKFDQTEPSPSSSRSLRRLKPPHLVKLPQQRERAPHTNQGTTPITSYRFVADASSDSVPEKSAPLQWKLPPPPSSPAPSVKAPVTLKRLHVPVIQPHTPPRKEMKTISTTRVARATDPMTESGHAELFSLFLQDQHHLISSPCRELSRGVHSSPEKGTRGKGPKFLRGGLADRASAILSGSHIAFCLWQRETENLSSSRRLTPDLRVLVMRVLYATKPSSRPRLSPADRSLVALCRVLKKDSTRTLRAETCILVLSPPHSPNARVSSVEDVKENQEIAIWQPWYQVDLPVGVGFEDVSFSASTEAGPSQAGSRVALLCSRFLVNRS